MRLISWLFSSHLGNFTPAFTTNDTIPSLTPALAGKNISLSEEEVVVKDIISGVSPLSRLDVEDPGPGFLVVAVQFSPGGASRGLAGGRREDLQVRRGRAGRHREARGGARGGAGRGETGAQESLGAL